jgi:hypothetical protein
MKKKSKGTLLPRRRAAANGRTASRHRAILAPPEIDDALRLDKLGRVVIPDPKKAQKFALFMHLYSGYVLDPDPIRPPRPPNPVDAMCGCNLYRRAQLPENLSDDGAVVPPPPDDDFPELHP